MGNSQAPPGTSLEATKSGSRRLFKGYGLPDCLRTDTVLLSKEYARQRAEKIDWERNDPDVLPGDPYLFQGT